MMTTTVAGFAQRGAAVLLLGALALAPTVATADEGGVSFWVPGFFGSLAAAPQQAGASLATLYYHPRVSAGADVAFARQVTRGNITANFSGNLNANLNANADVVMAIPSYVFATPVLGGQAAMALVVPMGRNNVSVDATLNAAIGPFGFSLSGGREDSVSGFGDPIPQFSLRWNAGVHNFMTYVTGNIPVGAYDSRRLANLGIGHGAVDAGGGYTYFNPQSGQEFTAVLGFTYNFLNQSTQYQNGVDMHLDWATSKFITNQWQIGLVGYVFNQLSCDSGAGDRVGCFESRVIGSRAADRLHLSARHPPGLHQSQGLQGIQCRAPAGRLERVAHVLDLAGAKRGAAAGHDQEVAGALEPRSRSLTARWSKGGAPRSTTEWLTTVKPPLQPGAPRAFQNFDEARQVPAPGPGVARAPLHR